jgi:ribosomal protein S18 acetylase RimI-like enzyme
MVVIRKADSKDFQTLIKVMKESTTDGEVIGFAPPEGIFPIFLKELMEELNRSDPGVIIAEKDGVPIGFAYYSFQNDFVEIQEADVIKEYQGQGIGKALTQHIEKIAKEKGIKCLVTGTSINKNGKPWRAYGFWVQMGFKDTGERIQGKHGLKYIKLVKQIPKA